MSRWARLSTLVAAIALLPSAASSVIGPLDECARQCHPTDPDVNGPQPRTGDAASSAILYAHMLDLVNRAPLHLQAPSAAFEADLNRGFVMPTANTETGTPADVKFSNNWFTWFHSPGFVEFYPGETRIHAEPGLAAEVRLAGDTINLYFYLSAHAVPNGNDDAFPGDVLDLGVLPQVAIYARTETGRHPFQGTLIAEGDTGEGDVANLLGGPGRATVVNVPGQPDIWEFQVPMKIKQRVIPSVWDGVAGFITSVNVYQVNAAGVQATQADWRVHTGADTPPRLVLSHYGALRTVSVDVDRVRGDVYVTWQILSPWGSYDLDDASLGLQLGHRDGTVELVRPIFVERSVDHDGHFKPTRVVFRVDGGDTGGDVTAKLVALNLQRTYVLGESIEL